MNTVERVLNLLFPPKCPFCERVMAQTTAYCTACQHTLPWTKGTHAEVPFSLACVSPFYYKDGVKESILRYKFNGRRNYAPVFGLLLAQCVQSSLPQSPDLVTWVPVSPRRRRQRGYDQAQLLAHAVGQHLCLNAQPLLEKTVHNPAQTSQKDAAARRANAMGVYRVLDECAAKGKTILLIDDVVTTGSTLSECARMLCQAGADGVFCAVLACAQHKDEVPAE